MTDTPFDLVGRLLKQCALRQNSIPAREAMEEAAARIQELELEVASLHRTDDQITEFITERLDKAREAALEDKSKALLHELDLWQDSIHPMPLPQHLLEDAVLILRAHLAFIEALKPMADVVMVPREPT